MKTLLFTFLIMIAIVLLIIVLIALICWLAPLVDYDIDEEPYSWNKTPEKEE